VGRLILDVLQSKGDEATIKRVQGEVKQFCEGYPVTPSLVKQPA
jgi:glycine/serine hydroxymethyltransferase